MAKENTSDVLKECLKGNHEFVSTDVVVIDNPNAVFRITRWCKNCGALREDKKDKDILYQGFYRPTEHPLLFQKFKEEEEKKPIQYVTERTKCIHRITADDIPPGLDSDFVALDCEDDPECPHRC